MLTNTQRRDQAQRIIPSLRFDCDGAITKWIVGASWRNNRNAQSFPDLQIWRNSSENGVYTKVGNTTLIATSSNSSQLYEFPVEPSLPFQRGDILGIFQPSRSRSRLRILYRTGSGNPLNFVFRIPENVTEPPLETFTTSSRGVTRQTVLPLVTMEICKLYKSSEFKIETIDYKTIPEYVDVIISIARSTSVVILPLLTATTHASLSPTSTTSSLLRTPAISPRSLSTPATSLLLGTSAILHTSSRAEISPTIIPKPSSSQIFTTVSMRQADHFSSFNSKIAMLSSTALATSENVPDHFSILPRTANASPLPSVSSPSFGGDNMESSFSVSTVGTVAGVGGSFLLAVVIVVLVMTVLLLLRRRKKKYFVSTDTDEHTLHNPLYGDL